MWKVLFKRDKLPGKPLLPVTRPINIGTGTLETVILKEAARRGIDASSITKVGMVSKDGNCKLPINLKEANWKTDHIGQLIMLLQINLPSSKPPALPKFQS
jgi:hypothetical protein